MPENKRILVVHRSRTAGQQIAHALRLEGHDVAIVERAATALQTMAEAAPALAIVDNALPDILGTELLRTLREGERWPTVPVIVTSDRDDEVDRVIAFELGADDFLVEPFSLRELTLRVRAILRRTAGGGRTRRREVVRVGPITLDIPRHLVTVDRRAVSLTPLEFRLLSHLASRAGRVQTREALLEDVWRQDGEGVTRAVDTSIKRLRRKLGRGGDWIETVRGVGYRMRDTPPRPAARADGSEKERCG